MRESGHFVASIAPKAVAVLGAAFEWEVCNLQFYSGPPPCFAASHSPATPLSNITNGLLTGIFNGLDFIFSAG